VKLNRDILRKLPRALRIEIDENAQRKQLTQSELAHVQRRLLVQLRKHKAPGTRTDLRKAKASSAKDFAQVDKRATKIVGRLFNESDRQLEKRLEVVAAAEAEPDKFAKLLATMNRTGRVNGVHRMLKVAKQAEEIAAEPPLLPGRGPYRVITADPAWPCARQDDPSHHGARPYPTMTIEEICAVDVASIAHTDCTLWLWTTNAEMRRAFVVLDAWGFQHRTILTWDKGKIGLGDWLRGQTEHCLMATRGKPIVTLSDQSTLLRAPGRAHSQKPSEFYDLVESLCPAPRYVDLFSRYRHSDKWDCHGNQAPQLEATE
jgi:N6-adenosine-specific RNA methylase IME4